MLMFATSSSVPHHALIMTAMLFPPDLMFLQVPLDGFFPFYVP